MSKPINVDTEFILPTGRFCKIRRICALDHLKSARYEHMIAALISLVVTIDDAALTYEEVLNLPSEEFVPILNKFGEIDTAISSFYGIKK